MAALPPPPRCPSLVQLTHNAAAVHNALGDSITAAADPVVGSLLKLCAAQTSIDFKDISPYQGFSADESSLTHLSWTKGTVRLSWRDPPEDMTLLCPHRRPSICVGLLHCPSIPAGTSLSSVFEDFCAKMELEYGHSLETIVVCALDIGDAQLEDVNLASLLQRGLEIFPPSTQLVDSGERAIDFHMRVVLSNACSRVIKSYDALIGEADVAAKQLHAAAIHRTSGMAILSPSPSPTQAPSCKHVETCRLFSGSPTYLGDLPPVLTSISGGSQNARKACKNLAARLMVWSAKHCLLAGSPMDALGRFDTAIGLCRQVEDLVWEGLAHEGMAAARAGIVVDGWGAVEHLNKTIKADLDTAIALYARSTQHAAGRRLHSEASLRAALVARASDDIYATVDYLQHARRVQSLHPALGWYLELEASLWDRAPKRLSCLAVLALVEAAEKYVELTDFSRALIVLERACSYVGAARMGGPSPLPPRKNWLASSLLRRILFVLRKDQHAPEGAICFYGAQLLSLGTASSPTEADTLVVALLSEHEHGVVKVGSLFAPVAVSVQGVEALRLAASPPRLVKGKDQQSAFIFSPFAAQRFGQVGATVPDEVLWVEGEPALVSLTLQRPFANVSCEVSLLNIENVPTSVVPPGPVDSTARCELGPFIVSRGLTELKIRLVVLGCEFFVDAPVPGVLAGLPLLVWSGEEGGDYGNQTGTLRNVGPVEAMIVSGSQGLLPPGGTLQVTQDCDVIYTDSLGRVERTLVSRLPLILAARVVRADTLDAIEGAWACASVQLRVAAPGGEAHAVLAGEHLATWTPASLQAEHVLALRSLADANELKSRLSITYEGVGALWAASSRVVVTSTAPPAWSASVRLVVSPEDATVLQFVSCEVFAEGFSSDARAEFVVFDSSADGIVALTATSEIVVWSGRPSAPIGPSGSHRVGVALAHQGRFLVGCRLSDARSSWWAGFSRVDVR